MKQHAWACVAAALLTSCTVMAAPLTDGFSTDTSANYTGSNSFNSGGSFTVSGGTLNLTAGSNNTVAVVHTSSSLRVGESYSIDLLDPWSGSGNSGGADGQFLVLTTGTGQTNGSSSFGFRFRIDRAGSIRLQTYSNGGNTLFDTGVNTNVAPGTFWVERVSATEFKFYHGLAGSRALITTGSLLASEAANTIHVGVQAYCASGSELYNFDNLRVGPATWPSITSFSASSESLSGPGPVTFTWSTQNAVSATLNGVDVTGQSPLTLTANESGDYTLEILGLDGSTISRTIRIDVALITPSDLAMAPSATTPGAYDFIWRSQPGESYDLLSSSGLSTPPAVWPVWNNHAGVAMSNLDGVVGWGTLAGNHELDWVDVIPGTTPAGAWLTPTPASGFEAWKARFGPVTTSRYAGMPEFGGAATNDVDTYFKYTAGGRTYLHLHLQADVPDTTIAWAQGIIDAHPGMPTLVSTHIFEGSVFGPPNNPYLSGPGRNSANQIWDKLIKNNRQVFMVLSGHTGQRQHQIRTNTAGDVVFTIVQDFAVLDVSSPKGYLRLYQFDEPNDVIHVTTYSPTLDTYLTDAANQFDLPLDFDVRLNPAP